MIKNINRLIKLLESQDIIVVDSGDYKKLEYEIENEDDGTIIKIPNVEIGFSFDKEGRFQGIFNWKE